MEERPHDRTAGRLGWLAVPLALCVLAALFALPRLERFYLIRSGHAAEATLRLAVEGLNGALRRYEPLPGLLGERPILKALLAHPDDSALRDRVNEELRRTAFDLNASDVYVMDRTGLTLAASSYRKELSFVGRNFGYRPYFLEAMKGGLGRFFALGTTSGERGYFYAAPVRDGERIAGVVAVKFTVDGFESAWQGGAADILVTDLDGIVFMSSRPDWHFRTLAPLSDAVLARIRETRQYPVDQMRPLENSRARLDDTLSLLTIGTGEEAESFVTSATTLEAAGWRVSILTPAAPALHQALTTLAAVGAAVLLIGLAATIVVQRRARILERLADQRAQQELLERRVAERTEDLRHEIEERKAAEHRLRTTQKQLVQAGKLAALGQMSAALSHEINQPLAAVKSYAENAATFLDRDRPDDARENVSRISQMADRMAAISGNLRNFARRPQESIGPVPADAVIDDTFGLMAAQIRKAGAVVEIVRPERPVWVMGGRLRLQQVMVNLVSNALDAMEGMEAPRIEIAVVETGGGARIAVRDHGPGLPEALIEQVFDPFFTTKRPGKGLGLGLSISFNIVEDFGGTLAARNHAGGGAEFTVDLRRAEAPGQPGDLAAE